MLVGFFFGFWFDFCSAVCCAQRCAIDGSAGWKLQTLRSLITTLGCDGSYSLSQQQRPTADPYFLQICLQISLNFLIWLLITTQARAPEFTVGKSDKEALRKLTAASKKKHKCSKSTGKFGPDVATQEYFAFQREQAADFSVRFSVQDHIYEKTLLILEFCCCK